jgi:hypothetical protein
VEYGSLERVFDVGHFILQVTFSVNGTILFLCS